MSCRNRFAIPLLLIAAWNLAACDRAGEPPEAGKSAVKVDMTAKMNSLADRYVEAALDRQPELAYSSNLPAPTHDRLIDNSLPALAQWHAFEDGLRAELDTIDETALAQREWVAWGALREMLDASRGMRICRSELWQGVNHMFSWHLMLTPIAARQPVATQQERDAALRRWKSLPAYIDTEIGNLQQGLDGGYSAAKPVAEAMLKQIEKMLAEPAEAWPLYSMAERAKDAKFQDELKNVIDTGIRPAVRRYRDFMVRTYIPAARENLSVTALPEGAACYRAMLREYTTLDRDPAEVHALGERTVDANRDYVLGMGKRLFQLDNIPAIVEHVKNAPDNRFETEQALVDRSRAMVEAAREKSAPLFLKLPEAKVVVEPFPEYQRGSGRSSHYQPPGAAGEPGEYRISLDFWQTETIGGAEITAVHETWPGHHLQIAMALALKDRHPIMKLAGNSGYLEGWARYAEQLAEEAGIYTSDYPLISRRLWPARGMVADPGIHILSWNAQQAADFMAEAGRFSLEESRTTVTRIAAIPGQLTAYDSGALVIFGLRKEAEDRLGKRFDIREFHQRLLENGSLPLWQLQDHVRKWIAAEAAAQTAGGG